MAIRHPRCRPCGKMLNKGVKTKLCRTIIENLKYSNHQKYMKFLEFSFGDYKSKICLSCYENFNENYKEL